MTDAAAGAQDLLLRRFPWRWRPLPRIYSRIHRPRTAPCPSTRRRDARCPARHRHADRGDPESGARPACPARVAPLTPRAQRHLPNKRHIGKQTPYCTVVFNGEKRRTKAIHRGGQHPEWDEEVRFTLLEDDADDALPRLEGLEQPPPPPPKRGGKRKVKGGKLMEVSVYADDPREPDLIGQTTIDLTEVLTKGETDGELASPTTLHTH
jgi:hypothetical protein